MAMASHGMQLAIPEHGAMHRPWNFSGRRASTLFGSVVAASPLLLSSLFAAVVLSMQKMRTEREQQLTFSARIPEDAAQMPRLLLAISAPSITMFVGSLSVLGSRLPEMLQACAQNFSAGLLLSAVAGELYPMMRGTQGTATQGHSHMYGGLCVGFALGLLFMLGLERLTNGMEEDESPEEGQANLDTPLILTTDDPQFIAAFQAQATHLRLGVGQLEKTLRDGGSRDRVDEVLHDLMLQVHKIQRQLDDRGPLDEQNLGRMLCHTQELLEEGEDLAAQQTLLGARRSLKKFDEVLEHIHGHTEKGRFQRWKPALPPMEGLLSENIPWPLVAAVTIDASVDGFLIGLSYSASESAGCAMSIATCIEMGFLGLSFSASVQSVTRSRSKLLGLALLPPAVLLAAGLLGVSLGDAMAANIGLFIGFISFAVVALLFLVTQELLAEAQEYGRGNSVVISFFFIGLLAGIILEQLLD